MTMTTASMRNLAERIGQRVHELKHQGVKGIVLRFRAESIMADLRRLADEVDGLVEELERRR